MKMKNKVKQLISHPMITGSSVIFIGSLFSSFLSFLFSLYMARNLSTEDYGTLTSLVSLAMIVSLPATAVTPLIVHFGSHYFANKELVRVRGLFLKILKPLIAVGAVCLLAFILFSPTITSFFHFVNPIYPVLVGLIAFFSYIGIVNTSLLQARLSFNFLTFYTILAAVLKLGLSVLFVFLGFGVAGAMGGLVLSYAIPYFVTFAPLRFVLKASTITPQINTKDLFQYGIPSSLTQLSLTSLVMSDILMVKHFFSPNDAGVYALLSVIAKVIFFFSAPISTVMFPLIVQRYTKKQPYAGTFIVALVLVLIPSIVLTSFFVLFPEVPFYFFKNPDSHKAIPYLGFFGVIIGVYSILSLITNFLLSIRKTSVAGLLTIAAIVQIGGISVFHSSFTEVLTVNLSTISLLLIILLLYYFVIGKISSSYASKT